MCTLQHDANRQKTPGSADILFAVEGH